MTGVRGSGIGVDRREFLARTSAAAAALVVPRVHSSGALILGNAAIALSAQVVDGHLTALRLSDKLGNREIGLPPDVFTLTLADGGVIRSGEMVVDAAVLEAIAPASDAARAAERLPGRQLRVSLSREPDDLTIEWRAVLREGGTYIRQEITIEIVHGERPVVEIALIDLPLPGATVTGSVRGSPITSGQLFCAFEHPLADSSVQDGRARSVLRRELPLRPGVRYEFSSVMGTTPRGQLRRGFLEYLERERAHPYRTFLHYNSWYDLGYFNPFDEAGALDRIDFFGRELHERRGVVLDSYLFDDGWDDHASLWRFNAGFPRGFVPLREAAARYGAAPGVWLSPWGGYGRPQQERLRYGREQGFETNEGGFALSGPKYYERFRDTCLDFIRTAGVNQFKFDGAGNVNHAIPGSRFGSDFEAAIALIGELRHEKPDLYVNLTTGTYPSPFWLRWADSIWRGGDDHDFAGVGPDRQRWITYRDGDTYAGIVKKGPLFPLSSLMLHGLIYAQHANKLNVDPDHVFPSEVRDYFGTGTQLQEMYITPSLLAPSDWDVIAESAQWSRANAAVLKDVHWVGGDPANLETYGWASWRPGKAILTVRNPKDAPQSMTVDVGEALELPEGARRRFAAKSPWAADRHAAPVTMEAGRPVTLDLAPFEVRNLELLPR